MPFLETGADELLRGDARRRAARARHRPGDDRADRPLRRRHRHAGRRVPRPVDDDLRARGRPDRAAPARRRARRPAQHGLPRHDRATSPSTSPSAAAASTWRSVRSASPRATRSRSCARCPRSSAPTPTPRPSAPRRCSPGLARQDHPDVTSREAELAKLFTNTWRYMKFAVANQFLMIADQAGVDYTNVLRAIREDYPRAADLPGPGLRRRPVPVQGHDAARGVHGRPLPDGPGRDAGQRGPAGLHRRRRSSDGTAASRARPSASSAWRSRPSPTTPARRSATSCASCCLGRRPRARAPTRTSATTGSSRSTRSSARATSSSSGAPHAPYRGLEIGGRDVVDVWGALGGGIRL